MNGPDHQIDGPNIIHDGAHQTKCPNNFRLVLPSDPLSEWSIFIEGKTQEEKQQAKRRGSKHLKVVPTRIMVKWLSFGVACSQNILKRKRLKKKEN